MNTARAAALLVLSAVLGAAQDRMAEMLRKGIVEEESNQNLGAAILAYQAVLTQFDEDRKTAATALFRLAESYRKQGKRDPAIAAYTRVVREFSDQVKLAEQSRAHLDRTYKLPQEPAAPARESATAEARRRYRALLEEELKLMEAQLKYEQQKYELGSSTSMDVARAKVELLRRQAELAAFEAALPPPGKN